MFSLVLTSSSNDKATNAVGVLIMLLVLSLHIFLRAMSKWNTFDKNLYIVSRVKSSVAFLLSPEC